jgi:hypothetical protein
MCSNTLYMSNMDAGSSGWGGCQAQSWCNDIILIPQVTQKPKIVRELSKRYWERKEHMWLLKSNGIKNVWGRETGKYHKISWWGQSGILTSTSKERGKKTCIIWSNCRRSIKNYGISLWTDYVLIRVALGVIYGIYEHIIAWVYIKKPFFY